MLTVFERAMQRRETRIAGLRLGPLTLAHVYALEAWGSPIARGGTIGIDDFALALWTCSVPCYPWHAYVDQVCRGAPDRKMEALGRRYDLAGFAGDVDALREWITWHCAVPERFMPRGAPTRGSSAPWPLVVAVQMIPVLGELRTWTSPVPYVMAHKIARDNANGDSSWKTEGEEELSKLNARSPTSNQ